jgi:hypothetical protein
MNTSTLRLRSFLGLALFICLACCTDGASEPQEEGLFRWSIATAVEIDAPPSRVWDVLVDLAAYPEWNPFIVEAQGIVAAGETLSLRMALPGREPTTVEPRLLVVDPGRELRWRGRILIPGLFDGEHAFVLTPLDDGRTRFDHSERFAGILLPVAKRMIYNATVEQFHALDAALARRVASLHTAAGAEQAGARAAPE